MTTYAFVQDGQVIEHSVSQQMLNARGISPLEWVKCTTLDKPEVQRWQTPTQVVTFDGEQVTVSYTARELTFSEIIEILIEMRERNNAGEFVDVSEYADKFKICQRMARMELRPYLDMYARQQGYGNFDAMCSYRTSSVAQYKQNGDDACRLKSDLYEAMDRMLAKVYEDKTYFPKSFQSFYDDCVKLMEQ